jgi:hypothetical protein
MTGWDFFFVIFFVTVPSILTKIVFCSVDWECSKAAMIIWTSHLIRALHLSTSGTPFYSSLPQERISWGILSYLSCMDTITVSGKIRGYIIS